MVNSENVKEVHHFEKAGKCSKVEKAYVRSENSKSNQSMKDMESEDNPRIVDEKP